MTPAEIRASLAEENPEALLCDDLEPALIGIARRCGQPALAVYSYRLAVALLVERDVISEEDAIEYLEFNTLGAWCGEHTPIWLTDGVDDD